MPPLVRTLAQGEYLGSPRRSFATHGIHVNESVYAPGVWLPPHRHRASNYCFLLAGGFRETSGRTRRHECARSHTLFRPPDEEHEQWFGPKGGRCLNVELSMSFLDRYGDLLRPLRRPIHADSAEFFVLGRRLQTELKHPDAVTTLAVEGLVLEMLSLSLRSREHLMSTTPPWLLDAQRLVKKRFKARLTLVELALAVGVHPAHLSRSFRRHFGISVAACIRRERLAWACRLLSETRLPVHEIALEAGYADQSHLTRALRLGRGLTPAVYRRRFGSTRSKMRA